MITVTILSLISVVGGVGSMVWAIFDYWRFSRRMDREARDADSRDFYRDTGTDPFFQDQGPR